MIVPYKFPNFQKAPKQCVADLIAYLSNLSFEVEAEMKLLSLNFTAPQNIKDATERSYIVYEGLKELTTRIDALIAYLEDL